MFKPGNIVLEGLEVTLRPMELTDASALAAASAEDRTHYGFNTVPDGPDATRRYVEHALTNRARGARFPFCIVRGQAVVGTTSYSDFQPWPWPAHAQALQRTRPDAVEIGYTWLAASAQRTRVNSEAKFLLLQYAFETWQVHRVSLRTDERNKRSRAAIERLGAKLDGVLRANQPGWDGAVRNSAFYSIVADEWPEVKSRLSQRLAS